MSISSICFLPTASIINITPYLQTKMVLTQPPNQHVMKAFDLTGKVAVVTGK